MRDFPASAIFSWLLDRPELARSNRGSRCRKLRLTREQSRRRSMAGMRRREEINRHNAALFIEEDPRRASEYARRNP
jgi:hypothetical protein